MEGWENLVREDLSEGETRENQNSQRTIQELITFGPNPTPVRRDCLPLSLYHKYPYVPSLLLPLSEIRLTSPFTPTLLSPI